MKKPLVTTDLLLLATDDSGKDLAQRRGRWGIAAAVLADLLLSGSLVLQAGNRLLALDSAYPDDPTLDAVLHRIASAKRQDTLTNWIFTLGFSAGSYRTTYLDKLVAAGQLREDEGKTPFNGKRFLPGDEEHEDAIRRRLQKVVQGDRLPDDHDEALLSLLKAVKLVKVIVPADESTKDFSRRVKQLVAEEPVGRAAEKISTMVEVGIVLGTAIISTNGIWDKFL